MQREIPAAYQRGIQPVEHLLQQSPHAVSVVVRIDPLHFLAGCLARPGPVYLSVTIDFIVLLFAIMATFCVLLVYVGMCSVFWLF